MNVFDVITGIILAIHLWCMAIATFASFYGIPAEWWEARGDASSGRVGRHLLSIGIAGLLVGTLVGVVYGLFLFDDGFSNALNRLSSRVMFGIAEWCISLGLFVGIRVWWGKRHECGKIERGFRIFLLFFAATNLAYHFPVLFEVLGNLRRESSASEIAVSSAEFRTWLAKPIVVSQVVHFLVASVVVGGAHLVIMTSFWNRQLTADSLRRHQRLGAHLIWGATVFQLFVGTWVTINLASANQMAITNLLNPKGILFALSILVSMALIPHAFSLAMRPAAKPSQMGLPIHVGIVLLLMSLLTRLAS